MRSLRVKTQACSAAAQKQSSSLAEAQAAAQVLVGIFAECTAEISLALSSGTAGSGNHVGDEEVESYELGDESLPFAEAASLVVAETGTVDAATDAAAVAPTITATAVVADADMLHD